MRKVSAAAFAVLISLTSGQSFAQNASHAHAHGHGPTDATSDETQMSRPMGPQDCDDMSVWTYSMGMCMPRAMKGMPMSMAMLTYNSFFTQVFQEKPRGTNAFAVPHFVMGDLGTTLGDRHYLNVDLMLTFERWTLPEAGYPELLQIGESNHDHVPYIDAQHPHSSPVMGLTFSDTISFGEGKDHAKIWFAPRGQSTEGPIAFMHRPTGMSNPDAPLGHHIGQDVGHITSTVIGASARVNDTTLELSTFNGTEPEPSEVDLPIASPNSYAVRLIREFNPHLYAMASAAYVREPESHDATLDHIWRYSASAYVDREIGDGWMFHSAFVWGLVNFYDRAGALHSFLDEVWVHKDRANLWGRLEVLQRTPRELEIATASAPDDGRWVTALTLGYTHQVFKSGMNQIGVGASVTQDYLPEEFQASYGSAHPISGRIFVQAVGMNMWHF